MVCGVEGPPGHGVQAGAGPMSVSVRHRPADYVGGYFLTWTSVRIGSPSWAYWTFWTFSE